MCSACLLVFFDASLWCRESCKQSGPHEGLRAVAQRGVLIRKLPVVERPSRTKVAIGIFFFFVGREKLLYACFLFGITNKFVSECVCVCG